MPLTKLHERLKKLRQTMVEAENLRQEFLLHAHPQNRESLRNLIHYLAMRRDDLHDLQLMLAAQGLSSLGRSEGFVLDNLNRVLQHLGEKETVPTQLDWSEAEHLLHRNTKALLGHKPQTRHVYIMITSPSAAEADTAWMAKSLRAGMNILRINCAHGDTAEWSALIANLRSATQQTGLACRILMDVAGPKLRTGPVHGGAEVLHLRVKRDVFGRLTEAARVAIHDTEEGAPGLNFPAAFNAQLKTGDVLRFRDSRGKKRELRIERSETGLSAQSEAPAYILKKTVFQLRRDKKFIVESECGPLPFVPAGILLKPGETLVLFAGNAEGFPADAAAGTPARIGCTLPEAISAIQPGQRVLFDDGKIGAVAESCGKGEVVLRIERARDTGSRLRGEKGINLPDTALGIPAITEKDKEDLQFVLAHADIVGASFIHSEADVRTLQQAIAHSGREIGLILKIETQAGFQNLPAILMQALEQNPAGVMIARGDLAVEVGFERLAEIQEEILWVCEAAHVPVIWATQVLENLAQTGQPSRAEITDAAMAVRAECVMLNKGPHIHEAVRVLDDILHKMEKHQYKKRNLYRSLSISW
ncbi:MAG: pyruvate kinase [Turneriella sp.]